MTVFDGLRKFDAFSKPQEDFRTKTIIGGVSKFIILYIVSITSIVVIFICTLFEWANYFRLNWRSEIKIDTNMQDQIPLYVDIVFPKLPCLFLNVDRSEANSHRFNNLFESEQNLKIERIPTQGGKNGRFAISKNSEKCSACIAEPGSCCRSCADQIFSFLKAGKEMPNLKTISECQSEGWPDSYEQALEEGCHVKGNLSISRVPGEFHFSLGKSFDTNGTHMHDISLFRGHNFDFSHKINSISFGESNSKASHSLNGVSVNLGAEDNITYSYYLKLVPYQLNYKCGKKSFGFHLSATRHQRKNIGESALPIIIFHYEFSAMSLIQTQSRRPFSSFLTGLCAIIGGIYTLSALLDSCLFSVERSIKVKSSYGKLY